MRIVSLQPSATETLCALGLADQIVGISHACDYPEEIQDRPRVSKSLLPAHLPSDEIHRRVQASAAGGRRLYAVDAEQLATLDPDMIVTQEQCSVCAVSENDVVEAVKATGCKGRILALSASRFGEVMNDVLKLGSVTNRQEEAANLVARMRMRLEDVRRRTAQARRPRVFCLSWFRPLMAASHWMTEMVSLAGGFDGLGANDGASAPLDGTRLHSYDPEAIFLMPCGFGLKRTIRQWQNPAIQVLCSDLHAVQNGRVYAVDGGVFHRPGPRLVDGVEVLASTLHPLRVPRRYPQQIIRRVA